MSIKLLSAVLDHFPYGGTRKLAMICLADHANDAGRNCYPSIARIAQRLCCSQSQARRQVHALIETGYVSVEHGTAQGGGGSRRYQINVDRLTPSMDARGSTDARGPLAPMQGDPSHGCEPNHKEPSSNRHKETSQRTRSARFDPSDLEFAKEMLADVKKLAPSTRANLDGWANDVRLIRECDGKTLADIRAMWTFAHADSFWRSNVLSPATLRKQWPKLEARQNAGSGNAAVKRTGFSQQDYNQGIGPDGRF